MAHAGGPFELFADALTILTHGTTYQEREAIFWQECDVITDTVSTEALAVVRSAVAGDMPSWFDDGGSPIQGYKIQWKSGTHEYGLSRQETYADLIFRNNLISSIVQQRIRLSG